MATLQPRPRATTRGGGGAAWGLTVLRICLGIFFLAESASKHGWFMNPGALAGQLNGWLQNPHPWSRWYLETVVLAAVPVFARLVPLAELATGVALVAGFWTRLAAALAFLMVLNFHVASSLLFQYRFLSSGYGLPVLGSLLALAIGAKGLPWSLRE